MTTRATYATSSSICLSFCLSVCPQNQYKMRFSQKLSNLELWSQLTICRKSYMGFSKNPLLDPQNSRWQRSAMLKILKWLYQQQSIRILMQFGNTTTHLILGDSQVIKDPVFKNSRWPTAAIYKLFFDHNSAASCSISVKFCMGKQFFTEF